MTIQTARSIWWAALAFFIASCHQRDKKVNTERAGKGVFFDYRIWGEEGKEEVNCLIQFRSGGPDGPVLLLKDPSGVELDGENLLADSAAQTGAFYETTKTLNDFSGEHSISFFDSGKKHRQDFSFLPFGLAVEIPEQISKRPFTIKFTGLSDKETTLRLSLTDTAFMTNDVNELVAVKNAEIEITQPMLQQLTAGPISIEIFREEEKNIHDGENERGKIWISYGLRREFTLVE